MTPTRLSPYQEKLILMKLQQPLRSYEQMAVALDRKLGTVKNDFWEIHRILGIKLNRDLRQAYESYKEIQRLSQTASQGESRPIEQLDSNSK
jgi:hypothetical protein